MVGATDLLSSEAGEVISLDLQQGRASLALQVVQALDDVAGLLAVGQRAAVRARSWTELDNGRVLADTAGRCLDSRTDLR